MSCWTGKIIQHDYELPLEAAGTANMHYWRPLDILPRSEVYGAEYMAHRCPKLGLDVDLLNSHQFQGLREGSPLFEEYIACMDKW
jgi:hypothetical protein